MEILKTEASLLEKFLKKAEEHSQRVYQAIQNTPSDYFEKNLKMRSGKSEGRMGSHYPDMDPEAIKKALLSAKWEPYNHPSVKKPAEAFKADIPGIFDVVEIKSLPPQTKVKLADPKGTGKLEAVVHGGSKSQEVAHTTILVGPHGDKEVVWTFFPGDPIMPSALEPGKYGDKDLTDGSELTAEEALATGKLEFAKVASSTKRRTVAQDLILLADILDQSGLHKEADSLDRFLKNAKRLREDRKKYRTESKPSGKRQMSEKIDRDLLNDNSGLRRNKLKEKIVDKDVESDIDLVNSKD